METFAEALNVMKTIATIVGGLIILIGMWFFGLALKDQESSGYSKGILFIVAGLIVIISTQKILPLVVAATGFIAVPGIPFLL